MDQMLYKEVLKGNIEEVIHLNRRGAGLEWIDNKGRTPLILACSGCDSLEMISTLLNLGANLNADSPGSDGGTPLHYAAKQGHDNIVALLLHRGANPWVTNDDGRTPLQMARDRRHDTVVRRIEGSVSLFCGMIRELSKPGFWSALRRQCVSKKIWAVVLPLHSALNNPRSPPSFELVIYPNPKDSQQRTIISLLRAEIEEPNFSLPDPPLVLFDNRTRTTYKFCSEHVGDKNQLQRFYEACKGTHERSICATASENLPLPEEEQLGRALYASWQTYAQENIPSTSRPPLTGNASARRSNYAPSAPPLLARSDGRARSFDFT